MRLLVVFTCVAAVTTGPALAGPRNLLLLVQPAPDTPEIARVRTHAAIPDVHTAHLPPDDHLTFGDAPEKPDPAEVEMPWFWRALREQVHTRLPKYEEQRFSLVVSPVIVKSPSDTIPGLGVGGVF